MTNRKLKIGLDYHGVIDKKPEYFSEFCKLAKEQGHHIYIITGGPVAKVRDDLDKAHIVYDFVFAISDYYQALGMAQQNPDGSIVVPKELWNKAKAEFCRRNRINFHIDDSSEYLHWFSTPFCLYEQNGDVCYLSPGIEVNLCKSPAEVLQKLQEVIRSLSL